jgi:phosphate transport system substrate-binding protein
MRVYVGIAILLSSLLWAAAAFGADPLGGGLKLAGSSTILPLAESVGRIYTGKFKQPLCIRGGGSSAGIDNVLSGEADIGLVSRALNEVEKAGLDYVTIGYDAVVIIVNRNNPLVEIRKNDLVALYSGRIRNWRELGGDDEPVLLISKLPGRSTLEIFNAYTGLNHWSQAEGSGIEPILESHEIGSNLEGATLVGGLPGAIGYVSMGTAKFLIDQGMPLKILKLDGLEGTKPNVKNGRYPLRRDLTLVHRKGDRKGKGFIDLFLSREGQDVLLEHGFITTGEM